jgi:hypothetical protein
MGDEVGIMQFWSSRGANKKRKNEYNEEERKNTYV